MPLPWNIPVKLHFQKQFSVAECVGNKASEITLVFLHGSTMTKEGMLVLAKAFPDIVLPKNGKKYYVFHYTTVLQLCIEKKYFFIPFICSEY